jgi:hypothetical protein
MREETLARFFRGEISVTILAADLAGAELRSDAVRR